jgi:hypothetical protein
MSFKIGTVTVFFFVKIKPLVVVPALRVAALGVAVLVAINFFLVVLLR